MYRAPPPSPRPGLVSTLTDAISIPAFTGRDDSHAIDSAVTDPIEGGCHQTLRSLPRADAKLLPMIFRFGSFELDLAAGELRKGGVVSLRRQDQLLRVLQTLTECPGALVTREELWKRLWPDDTFVDRDNRLNNAVRRLRAVLDDQAFSPRFVETVEKTRLPLRGANIHGCPAPGVAALGEVAADAAVGAAVPNASP